MTMLESVRIAWRALLAGRLRSFLTMLGIIIGVSSVIAMVSIGSGAKVMIADQIRSLGANVLMVLPGAASGGGARLKRGSRHTLTEDDAVALAAAVPSVAHAAPSVRGVAQIIRGSRNWRTTVNGTTGDYFLVRDWPLASGRYFAPAETARAAKVAVIGRTVAKSLFGAESAAGGRVRIMQTPFEVIGVLAEKGPSGSGRDQDDVVFVPISTAKKRLFGSAHEINPGSVAYILVEAKSDSAMAAAERGIRQLLTYRHGIRRGEAADFTITNPAAAMQAQHASGQTLAFLLAAIASISLIVGGISIMNIMLVSVTERTREVGLRRAVGARARDIRNQFLIEALILSLFGGAIGVVLGIGAAVGLARFGGWPVFIGPGAVLGAMGFSALVGIGFGYYPARRAASIQPIEALRTE